MNTLDHIKAHIFPAAFALLPAGMDSAPARAMLVAIGLQESRFKYRKQVGGPAHGFWQFEHGGGVRGVLQHPQTRNTIREVLTTLSYDDTTLTSYNAIVDNDVLACCYARLLLFTLPNTLPAQGDADEGWRQYISAWRPGKPHRETWDAFYLQAWS